MAMLPDGLLSATETPIPIDYANTWIPDVRLNAGDRNGRTITVALTNMGASITDSSGLTATLLYNTNPGRNLGNKVQMTLVPDTGTTTFSAALPDAALRQPGVIALGVEVSDGTHTLCTRTFNGIVERAVYDETSPEIEDDKSDLQQLIKDAQNATNEAKATVANASIDMGSVSTLDPNANATASLTGTGLKRVLNLGIPRGTGPKGDKGDPGQRGEKGDPGDAGQVATATVAGVVKPGNGLTVRADGTLDWTNSLGFTSIGAGLATISGALQISAGKGLQLASSTVGVDAGDGLAFNEHQQLTASLTTMSLDSASDRGTVSGFAILIGPQKYLVFVTELEAEEDAEYYSFQLTARNGGIAFTGAYYGADQDEGTASNVMTLLMYNGSVKLNATFTYSSGSGNWSVSKTSVGAQGATIQPFVMVMFGQMQSAKA